MRTGSLTGREELAVRVGVGILLETAKKQAFELRDMVWFLESAFWGISSDQVS